MIPSALPTIIGVKSTEDEVLVVVTVALTSAEVHDNNMHYYEDYLESTWNKLL